MASLTLPTIEPVTILTRDMPLHLHMPTSLVVKHWQVTQKASWNTHRSDKWGRDCGPAVQSRPQPPGCWWPTWSTGGEKQNQVRGPEIRLEESKRQSSYITDRRGEWSGDIEDRGDGERGRRGKKRNPGQQKYSVMCTSLPCFPLTANSCIEARSADYFAQAKRGAKGWEIPLHKLGLIRAENRI